MSRKASNKLTLKALPGGLFWLRGFINGKRIRMQSGDVAELEALKMKLETDALSAQLPEDNGIRTVATFVPLDWIRDTEAAFRKLAGRAHSLLDCVEYALANMGEGKPQDVLEALNLWDESQEALRRSKHTRDDNTSQVKAFLAQARVEFLGEISSLQIEKYVIARGLKPWTQYHRGSVLRTFFNFCLRRKWLKVSPFQIELSEIQKLAHRELSDRRTEREEEGTNILTPAQCKKLLQATASEEDGLLLPYAVFSLWCFMRNAEVVNLTWNKIKATETEVKVKVMSRKAHSTVPDRWVVVPENVAPIIRLAYEQAKARGKDELKKTVPYSRDAWENIQEKAGLVTRVEEIGDSGHAYRKITESIWYPHLLRHTGLTYRFKLADDIKIATKEAGNSPGVAFRHYIEKLSEEETCEETDAKKFYSITLAPAALPVPQVA